MKRDKTRAHWILCWYKLLWSGYGYTRILHYFFIFYYYLNSFNAQASMVPPSIALLFFKYIFFFSFSSLKKRREKNKREEIRRFFWTAIQQQQYRVGAHSTVATSGADGLQTPAVLYTYTSQGIVTGCLAGLYPRWLDTGCDGAFSGLFQNNTYAFLFSYSCFFKAQHGHWRVEKEEEEKKTLEWIGTCLHICHLVKHKPIFLNQVNLEK